jgi:predicted alpha/beta hydrolase family esterase
MKKKQQILLIHGGNAHKNHQSYLENLKNSKPRLEWILSQRRWKNELQDQLGEQYAVYIPQMPNKQNAQYHEWKILFEKIVNLLDEDFILIGHSLGGIFLVKYLSENSINKRVKKTHLLGTPFSDEDMINEKLYSFLREGSLKNLEKQAGKLYFYHSEDDFAVPFIHLSKFEKELPSANFRTFKNRNHFLQEEVPELIDDIKN